MKSSIGINWQYGLMVNMSELAFAAFMEPELQRQVLRARMAEPGLVLNPAGCGNMGLAWRLEQVVAGGDLLIRFDRGVPWAGAPVISGVMSDGEAFAIELDPSDSYLQLSDITVPDDGVWRTLLVARATTIYEPGIATFTAASLTVTDVLRVDMVRPVATLPRRTISFFTPDRISSIASRIAKAPGVIMIR